MSLARSGVFPAMRLKFVVVLRRSRPDSDCEQRPYVGLEDVESWTGRLLAEPGGTGADDAAHAPEVGNTFEPGDVLFGKLRPYLAKSWLAEFAGRSTGEFLVMQPVGIDARFLRYICVGQQFVNAVTASAFGSKMPRAEWDFIGGIRVPVPDAPQQRAIADYLDRETARIDALIAAKQRLIDLLDEKRRTLLARAVTRGINPAAPLRDSGIPWLGEIPAHWEVERARWLFRERDQRSEFGQEDPLTVSHITGVTLRSERDVKMFEAETKEGYKLCLANDLVINTLWAWMGAMGVTSIGGIVSPAYNVYEMGERLDPLYVDALVRLPAFAEEATRFSKGVWSSRLRLYPEGFFQIYLPVPPRREQQEIIFYVHHEDQKLGGLRAAAERTVALLKERRAALIGAAITGGLYIA